MITHRKRCSGTVVAHAASVITAFNCLLPGGSNFYLRSRYCQDRHRPTKLWCFSVGKASISTPIPAIRFNRFPAKSGGSSTRVPSHSQGDKTLYTAGKVSYDGFLSSVPYLYGWSANIDVMRFIKFHKPDKEVPTGFKVFMIDASWCHPLLHDPYRSTYLSACSPRDSSRLRHHAGKFDVTIFHTNNTVFLSCEDTCWINLL